MIEIRTATVEDSSQIQKLMLQALSSDPNAFNVDADEYMIKDEVWWKNYLASYFIPERGFMLLLINDGEIIGISAAMFHQAKRSRHNADIYWVFVNKNHRGKGYSKMLLTEVMNRIKQNPEIRKISLNVNATQEVAIKIYKQLGFTQTGYYKEELLIDDKYVDKISFEKFI